ncbi:MAG: aconitate hydratase B, partial [Myxococcales bacterium]|nr:aconitate hydratase B [Myxococcales bacterium]
MLDEYKQHAAERAALGLPPKPLNSTQTTALVELLVRPPAGEEARLLELVRERVPGGVDPAAAVKAAFLSSLARGEARSPLIDRARAVALLGGMSGGHSVAPLVALLDDDALGERAAVELAATLLIFDAFGDVAARAAAGCEPAARVLHAWADAEWFTRRPAPPRRITVIAFKIDGEITTDDLSPAVDAWSRPDIPLHARSLLRRRAPDALAQLAALRRSGHPVAFVGDVVGTGS